MKASKLLSIIRKDIKDYPIEYLKNKVTDEDNFETVLQLSKQQVNKLKG